MQQETPWAAPASCQRAACPQPWGSQETSPYGAECCLPTEIRGPGRGTGNRKDSDGRIGQGKAGGGVWVL